MAKVTCAADIEEKPVEWLWNNHVPIGMLTLFAGDPKIGKSFLTIALATATSRGACASLPGGGDDGGPGSVVIMSAEDDPARTIKPRLRAAGADMSRVHILESVFLSDGSEALPSLRHDIEAIESVVRGLGDCRMISIDPISSYLGGTDDHKNGELRGILSPLKSLVERNNVACPMVSHLTKASGGNGKHRVQGSIAYVGACRANFLCIKDRNDPTGRRVLICDNGVNLCGEVPTLAYMIDNGPHGPSLQFFSDPVSITANEALAAEAEACQAQRHNPERKETKAWLKEVLSGGPVLSKEVEAAARNCGVSAKMLRNAKEDSDVVVYREGFGKDGKWFWRLNDASN